MANSTTQNTTIANTHKDLTGIPRVVGGFGVSRRHSYKQQHNNDPCAHCCKRCTQTHTSLITVKRHPQQRLHIPDSHSACISVRVEGPNDHSPQQSSNACPHTPGQPQVHRRVIEGVEKQQRDK
ncbi:uncharacterized protein TM35_000012350 [Trypanosoma theileri]|uniref:Uncharacterized protein n=1 Tax=Trypanosoma theileri TaxID=67003 RepID=A0A1X0P902_9TRYP|nr:uncharacterized protein TM35_000012350 [Trypanosoma theileri]ORC93358.1 hypothetical protein TM35_000012350 [Trypanosoma theileri]